MTKPRGGHLLVLAGTLLLSLCCCTVARAGATIDGNKSDSGSSNTTASELNSTTQATPATQTTPIITTMAASGAAATSAGPAVTVREPTEQEISEARKIIQEVASTMKETNPHRLVMNKPAPSSLLHDYPPDSPEALVSEATGHFGLSLMRADSQLASANNQTAARQDNTIISPISLQILMNLVLLGTKDQSAAQLELAQALGYERLPSLSLRRPAGELEGNSSKRPEERGRLLRPHEAMQRVVESIMKATHLSVEDRHLQQLLLNSNPASEGAPGEQLEAHLQTSLRDNDTPLSGQLNFTLANLMLTNRQLLQTSAEYERQLQQYYQTKVERFSREPGAGKGERPLVERLNDWVRNATQGQIGELVSRETLEDPLLLVLLINAAHFKGQWLHTFNTRLTEERTFYNFGHEPKETKFMRQNGQFAYAEFGGQPARRRRAPEDDQETTVIDYSSEQAPGERPAGQRLAALNISCSAIALPFSLNDGQEISMVLLLPSKRDGLDELLRQLDVAALNEVYRALGAEPQSVQVELPKFTMEAAHDVRRLLESLGVRRIFSQSEAELDHMFGVPKPPAFVSKIIHKAKIAVDEKGAEAAAASLATVNMRSSIHISLPTFVADHPFLYIIRHSRTNMPLFMGQVRRF